MFKIFLTIDESERECNLFSKKLEPVEIQENQSVAVKVVVPFFELTDSKKFPIIFFEDLELPTTVRETDNSISFLTSKLQLFQCVFGECFIRVYFNDSEHRIILDIKVNKINASQAESMISYLFTKSQEIIRLCLSRSTLKTGTIADSNCDPESMISISENIIKLMRDSKLALLNNLKRRLIPKKSDAYKAIKSSAGLDLNDLLDNLDILRPISGNGDVLLHGKHFEISAMLATNLHETSNVEENHVLIGGLYSILRKITDLKSSLENAQSSTRIQFYDDEHKIITDNCTFVSLRKTLAKITSKSLIIRCLRLIESVEDIINFFENNLDIEYKGEMIPKFTPFVRSSRLYRDLFIQLQKWYDLGIPTLTGLNFIIKLRSMSKIFEYVVLFQTIDFFKDLCWEIETYYDTDKTFDLPVKIIFTKENEKLILKYEPKIFPFNKIDTKHQEIVDLKHKLNGKWYPFWNPDFIIQHIIQDEIAYIILDAKYSTPQSIRDIALLDIVDKYYMQVGVYDDITKTIDKSKILAVLAIFPMSNNDMTYINYYKGCKDKFSFNLNIPILPCLCGVPLSTDNENKFFKESLNKILNISKQKNKNLH